MKLHTLKPAKGAVKTAKRIGRGQGSTRGGTATKGNKGQIRNSGYNYKPGFEGGQMPLQRRLPKYGFKNIFRKEYKVVNLDTLEELALENPGVEINHQFLVEHGIISSVRKQVKVLGRGELKAAISVKLDRYSDSAKQAIEAAGGTILEIKSQSDTI